MNTHPCFSGLWPKPPRCGNWRAPLSFGLWLSLLCLAALPLQAEERGLAVLYQRFLSGQQSTGFVAFERHQVYPQRRPHPSLNSGAAAENNQFAPPKSDYWCFLWSGPKFLIVSSDAPITKETGLAGSTTALRTFYGYDGETFWNLRLNAMRTYEQVDGKPDLQHPVEVASILAVFPQAEEAALARAGRESNRELAGILERAAESRRVAQMGFSLPLAEPPTLVRSNLLLLKGRDGRSQNAQFTGRQARPATLEYFSSSNVVGNFRVTLGFQANTLIIERLSSRTRQSLSTTRYQVLAASVPSSSLAASVFSWPTYQPISGLLIRETGRRVGEDAQSIGDENE